MVTMAKGGLSFLLFNLRKMLNHRITVICITVALAFYVSWQAGSLVWKLWLLNDASPRQTALIPLSSDNTETESLQDLLSYPLIKSASIATEQDSASINAPKTSLKLKLVGLMYSTDKNQARAIIEDPKDGARSYAIRERVADKAEIDSIEPDRVILNHAGRHEALLLDPDHNTSSSQAGTGNQPVNDPIANTSQVSGTNMGQASGTNIRQANINRTSSESRPASSQYSKELPRGPAEVMRDFSATPVMENGELLGFRLNAVRNPEIMKEWGIEPTDVITAVNGISLNAPGRIMVLYDKLKKQREFEITLNNGGSSRTITVDLNE